MERNHTKTQQDFFFILFTTPFSFTLLNIWASCGLPLWKIVFLVTWYVVVAVVAVLLLLCWLMLAGAGVGAAAWVCELNRLYS